MNVGYAVAYLGGWTGSDVHPLRATINLFQHVLGLIYIAKIMGLLHANRVQSKAKLRYFIHYSHRDIELDYDSDIDEFGHKNHLESFFKILINSRKLGP